MPQPLHYVVRQTTITEDPAEYVLSDGDVDRMGDIIEPGGWELSEFSPVALFNHQRDSIIGRWDNVRVNNRQQLVGTLVLAEAGTSPIVDTTRALVRQQMLQTTSVGFRAVEEEPLNPRNPWEGTRYLKSELLEASLVAVAANPRARRIAKQYLSDAEVDAFFPAMSGAKDQRSRSVVRGMSAGTHPTRGTKMPQRIAEGIVAKQNQIVALRDRLAAIKKGVEASPDLEMSDADAEEMESIVEEIKGLELSLQRLERMETTMGERAVEQSGDDANDGAIEARPMPLTIRRSAALAGGGNQQEAIREAARNSRGYDLLVRAALCQFVGHIERKNPMQVMQERYGKHKQVRDIELIVKTTSAPAMTTVVGWAAELVGANVQALLDTLMPVSIYPQLAARGTSLTFDGAVPIIIPSRQYGTVPGSGVETSRNKRLSGAFVGEGQPIPVRQGLFKSLTLNPYKMAVISTFTREMALSSTPAMEQIIREAIAEDTAWALDMALLSDEAAIPGVRPAGIFNGLSTLPPAAAGPDAALSDLMALAGAVIGAGGGRSVVFIMNPLQAMHLTFLHEGGVFMFRGEIAGGTLLTYGLVVSTTVPVGEVYCIDAADFASGTGVPVYDVSDQATLHMDDGTYPAPFTAPTVQPISSAGTPNVVAAPVRSLWQTASIGVRMIMATSWAMRRAGMVAFITGVNW